MDDRVHLKFEASASSAIDAYFEYRNIVGDDDNGKLFTPEQYEEYKKKVLPMRLKNRLYVSWSNPEGVDCKVIGPETQCFCQHRYKQHQTDFDNPVKNNSELKCKVSNCHCSGYHYIPRNGNQVLRCHCKHAVNEHREGSPRSCKAKQCKCDNFGTSFRCGCGNLVSAHTLLIESREERIKRGHPVAREEPPFAAMGALTGMSSLIDGYMRLDDSGIGAPPDDFFDQATTSRSSFTQVRSSMTKQPQALKYKKRSRSPWNS